MKPALVTTSDRIGQAGRIRYPIARLNFGLALSVLPKERLLITSQQLGERLTDARKRARLTQAEVADQVAIARTTLVAIEKGERRPSNAELVRLAEVLKTSVHDLLRETLVRAELSPRFRVGFGIDKKSSPIAEAVERLRTFGARYASLERLQELHRVPARLETLRTYRVDLGQHHTLDDRLAGEDAARTVRSMLGLGDEPALHLDERFEVEAGLRIFYLDRLPSKLAAFLLWSDEIGACVAINADHPAEKQRWSLVHEVGHLLRDPEAGDVLDESEPPKRAEELFPDSFATELLMPAVGVQKRFADKCRAGRFAPIDLHSLARHFGVSFQAMALRLEDLRLLPRGSYEKITKRQIRPRELAPHEVQPSLLPASRQMLPERYVTLAVAAYDRELLSEGEFAEYLDTDIATARRVYQEHLKIHLDDGTQLPIDFAADDLRTA
ncbi:MAG TPA: XRE family transcriptional regulator [Kofleriaceae bacterium]|nr:XRE family transcriptional regulator [Kofleriaceae bacterium]